MDENHEWFLNHTYIWIWND